jgi:hypothetical protein
MAIRNLRISKNSWNLPKCVRPLVEACQVGPARGIVLRWDRAYWGGARVNSGEPRGAEGGRVWRVRRRQQAGNRVVFGRRKAALLGPFARSRAVAEGCEYLRKGG